MNGSLNHTKPAIRVGCYAKSQWRRFVDRNR
jgi:hypothetical protein